jgi:hypothetical protein
VVWVIILLVFLFTAKPVLAATLINEFMAHPGSGSSEWVEVYNPDNLDLSAFWIDDDTSFTSDSGSSSKKSLSSIGTGIYPYIDLNSMLNNSGDYIVLFSGDGTIIDQYQYTTDPGTDVTIGRSPDGGSFVTLSTSSKGATNGSASTPSPSTSPITSSTFSISNTYSEINSDSSFKVSVNLTLTNYPNTKFYLKGAFKKSDSSNYFGLTKVNSSWVQNGSSYINQYQITTDSSGHWSGELDLQPDVLDSGYEGSGDYLLKVGRYSDSGSGPTWSNEVTIKINAIEIEEGVVNLSGVGIKEEKEEVLGEDAEEELSEEIYSLEKYKRLASDSGNFTSSASSATKIKSEKSVNVLLIIGTILIIGTLLVTIITYANNKFRS